MLNGEATNTNLIVFGFTWSGLEPTIYRTRGEHANHNTTDMIKTIEIVNTYNMLEVKGSHQASGMEQGQKCLIFDYQLNNMLDSSGQHCN